MASSVKQPASLFPGDANHSPPEPPNKATWLPVHFIAAWWRSVHTLLGLAQMAVIRLRYYSGLSLLALLGVILAVGLVTSAAFFAQAVDQVIMNRELAEYTRLTGRPPFAARVFSASSPSVPFTLERAETLGKHVADTLTSEVRLPVRSVTMLVDSGILRLLARPDDSRYTSGRPLGDASLAYMSNIAAYMTIEGAGLDDGASDGMLDVWMHAAQAARLGVQLGDQFLLAVPNRDFAIPIRLAAFWQPIDPKDAYWMSDPNQTLRDKLFVRRGDYQALVEPVLSPAVRTATWQVVLDESKVVPARARNYKEGFERASAIVPRYLPDARLTTPTVSLEKFVGQQTALTTLLLGFNVPALAFLLYFLVLTSAVIAYWQRRETALLRSRGITRTSILNYTFMEGILLFLIGGPLGLWLGLELARLMGYAVSFLEFGSRPPLPVSINGINLPLTIITLLVVLAAKLWTVSSSAGQTVVTQQREHVRPTRGPFWYRSYIDLLLVIPAIYAYRQLSQQGWLGALVKDRAEDLYQDPLLILVPGLFIITLALLSMRIFPLFMRLLDWSAKFVPWFTGYLAFRQLGRQSHSYINPLLLVIVSLALGVYTLSMAGSMDQWLSDRVYYQVGAELRFTPYSESEAMAEPGTRMGADWIPPIDEFTALPAVEHAARVATYQAEIYMAPGTSQRVPSRFMGIDRLDFPLTAWYRSDFARESLGGLMNRLAAFPEGVLVPQEFLDTHALRIGDSLSMLVLADFGASVRSQFTIVGVFDYFPTAYQDRVTVVGNLEYINSFFGLTMPHHIWLRLAEGATMDEALAAVRTTGIDHVGVQSASALLNSEQSQMERVGVFGTLSVGFLAAALMAGLGLLTYSYASLHERLYQFSVLRAIGINRGEIVGQVALEYIVLTLFGAAAGILCGSITATLFVPLFRVSTGATAPLPPLLPVIAQEQIIPLAALFVGVMVILEIFIISSTFYRRLFEALRLGHHG
jgi:putative ABC transport system permease protein